MGTPYIAGAWDSSQSLRRTLAAAIAAVLLLSLMIANPPTISVGGSGALQQQAHVRLPVSFETNVGQAPAAYDFLTRGEDLSLFLSPQRATMAFGESESVSMKLLEADRNAPPFTGEAASGVVNYFVGDDPEKWISGAPTHSSVGFRDVYPGIDVLYYGNGQQLEFDFNVSRGSDPAAIELAFSGANEVRLDGGDLVVESTAGSLRWQKPVAYQEVDGTRQPVDVRFNLKGDATVGFTVGDYDPRYELVIDPVLQYSTYLGGSLQEIAAAVGVDSAGNIYLSGETSSVDFPTQNPVQPNYAGDIDGFAAKINVATNTLEYSTYLGGTLDEDPRSMAVDPSGTVYVVGATSSSDYPTTPGAYQPSLAGGKDAYITRLGPTGAMEASTFLGGTSQDARTNVALDPSGVVHVVGYSKSNNFPVTGNAIQPIKSGNNDNYLVRLSSDLSTLLYGTYIGGSHHDTGRSVAADSAGNSYVVSWTMSADYPTTPGAFQPTFGGGVDTAISKVSADGNQLVYSSYIGGSGDDWGPYSGGQGAAVDAAGNAYVVGFTSSTDLPVVNALQPTYGGGEEDGFAVRITPDGSALDWATYLGGTSKDEALGIAADSSGAAYAVGLTQSSNFPSIDPLQAPGGGMDAFITKIEPNGASVFSSTLGGRGTDKGRGVFVTSDAVYVSGQTAATDFPTVNALQPSNAGKADAFVVKIAEGGGGDPPPPPPPPPPGDDTTPPTVTLHQPGPDTIGKDGSIKVKWDGSDNVGVDHYDLYEKLGIGGVPERVQSSGARTYQTTGDAGNTYCYYVEAFDAADNSSTSEERCVAVPHDDRSAAVLYTGGVTETSSSGAYFGTLTVLDGAGQEATFTFTGRKFAIVAQKNPASGRADVYIDGILSGGIDLYGSSVKEQAVVYNATVPEGAHTIEIRWTEAKKPQSSGTAISLDGIAAISE